MNVDLASGLWRFHQVPEVRVGYSDWEAPGETGQSSTILFDFFPLGSPVPDNRFGSAGHWYGAKAAWAHSAPGTFWLQLFEPGNSATPSGWILQIVQKDFADQAGKTNRNYLRLWVARLFEHPDSGALRVRFLGQGRSNEGESSGGRLSFTLTQQVEGDPVGVMNGYPPNWQANKR